MKNKKIQVLITIMAIAAICLVGCGKNKDTQKQPNDVGENNNVVEQQGTTNNETTDSGEKLTDYEKFSKLQESISDELAEYVPAFYNMQSYFISSEEVDSNQYGVSSLLVNLKGTEDPFSKLSYNLKDLNDDGVEELLVFYDDGFENAERVIVSMYTLRGPGRECYHIFNSQNNMNFKLYEDNIIKLEMLSESATVDFYYKLTKNNMELKQITEDISVDELQEVVLEKTPVK